MASSPRDRRPRPAGDRSSGLAREGGGGDGNEAFRGRAETQRAERGTHCPRHGLVQNSSSHSLLQELGASAARRRVHAVMSRVVPIRKIFDREAPRARRTSRTACLLRRAWDIGLNEVCIGGCCLKPLKSGWGGVVTTHGCDVSRSIFVVFSNACRLRLLGCRTCGAFGKARGVQEGRRTLHSGLATCKPFHRSLSVAAVAMLNHGLLSLAAAELRTTPPSSSVGVPTSSSPVPFACSRRGREELSREMSVSDETKAIAEAKKKCVPSFLLLRATCLVDGFLHGV